MLPILNSSKSSKSVRCTSRRPFMHLRQSSPNSKASFICPVAILTSHSNVPTSASRKTGIHRLRAERLYEAHVFLAAAVAAVAAAGWTPLLLVSSSSSDHSADELISASKRSVIEIDFRRWRRRRWHRPPSTSSYNPTTSKVTTPVTTG